MKLRHLPVLVAVALTACGDDARSRNHRASSGVVDANATDRYLLSVPGMH